MTYVLLIVICSWRSGCVMHTDSFTTMDECEKARVAVVSQFNRDGSGAVCYEKFKR